MQDAQEPQGIGHGVVLESYKAENGQPQPQLNLQVGDGVVLLQMAGRWAQGQVSGELGWFPAKAVMILSSTTAQSPNFENADKKDKKKVKAASSKQKPPKNAPLSPSSTTPISIPKRSDAPIAYEGGLPPPPFGSPPSLPNPPLPPPSSSVPLGGSVEQLNSQSTSAANSRQGRSATISGPVPNLPPPMLGPPSAIPLQIGLRWTKREDGQ
jgi:hypothetical protein